MRFIFLMPFVLLCSVVTGCSKTNETMEHNVIKGFDAERYLGKWYEIARMDHSFERGLEGVTANYSIMENGMIRVENSGHVASVSGELKTAIGKAKLGAPNNSEKPGYLKVSFFLWFYAPYYIMVLDADYSYALVVGKGYNYLWILSRSTQLDQTIVDNLLETARSAGFDISKVQFVQQPTE